MRGQEKTAYSDPLDFHEDVLHVIEKKNSDLSAELGKHIEFCFFLETSYTKTVKNILAEVDNSPLETILKKLDAAYQKVLVDQGFDKPGVTYN